MFAWMLKWEILSFEVLILCNFLDQDQTKKGRKRGSAWDNISAWLPFQILSSQVLNSMYSKLKFGLEYITLCNIISCTYIIYKAVLAWIKILLAIYIKHSSFDIEFTRLAKSWFLSVLIESFCILALSKWPPCKARVRSGNWES